MLSLFRQYKRATRQELAKKMGVSKNTISLIVEELISAQVLKEVGIKEPGAKGRPKSIIEMSDNTYKSIGFIVSADNIEFSVIDYSSKQLEKRKIEFDGKNPEQVIGKITSLINELLNKYERVLGIGIGIPGIVNVETRTVYTSTHLGWKNITFNFEGLINADIPVFVQNSVKMGALYALEKEGDQKRTSSFYVRVGEGVGGACLINNTLINGGSWTAGEIGHISIDPTGEVCVCGQRGCLEMLINAKAFFKEIEGFDLNAESGEIYQNIGSCKSQEINDLMDLFGAYLGKALVQVVHLINPSQIIIDAPYNSHSQFLKSCLDYMQKNALEVSFNQTKLVFGKERYSSSNGAALSVLVNYEKFVF